MKNHLKFARFLGVFSLVLGLTELLFPRRLARVLGAQRPGLLRALGARELATGVGLLFQRRPAPWVWARVGGDVLDLAILGATYRANRSRHKRGNVAAATGAVAGITLLDFVCGRLLGAARH